MVGNNARIERVIRGGGCELHIFLQRAVVQLHAVGYCLPLDSQRVDCFTLTSQLTRRLKDRTAQRHLKRIRVDDLRDPSIAG